MPLDENRHIKLMCDTLERVYRKEISRLIINVPPRSLKTEIVSKAYTNWVLGNDPYHKFIVTSYAAGLAEKNSWEARNMYISQTNNIIFPRNPLLKEDQNTKQHWENVVGWQYYAAGSSGTITGIGCDTLIIDDPINPEEANSDLVRTKVNNNYHDTLKTRLNDKHTGSIIIIMQRLHDDDLCWHLMEAERNGTGDKRTKIIVPSIAVEDDEYRKKGESFFEKRFPLQFLQAIQRENATTFSTQFQQDPFSREAQEFHEEWFRYYEQKPRWLRIFTSCVPAFKKWEDNDYSCVMTAWFDGMDMYILEYTVGRYDAGELINKLMYHIQKRNPEKVGIEAFQAQTIIAFNLRARLEQKGLSANIEELTQKGDKNTKIRKLVALYREWHIYHTRDMSELEVQLKKFPRGKHDDIIDAEQMLYDLYTIQPNTVAYSTDHIKIEYDSNWTPFLVNNEQTSWLA